MTSSILPLDRDAIASKLRTADPMDCRLWLLLVTKADTAHRTLVATYEQLATSLDLPPYAIAASLGRLHAHDWLEVEPHAMPGHVQIHLLFAPRAQAPPPNGLPLEPI